MIISDPNTDVLRLFSTAQAKILRDYNAQNNPFACLIVLMSRSSGSAAYVVGQPTDEQLKEGLAAGMQFLSTNLSADDQWKCPFPKCPFEITNFNHLMEHLQNHDLTKFKLFLGTGMRIIKKGCRPRKKRGQKKRSLRSR